MRRRPGGPIGALALVWLAACASGSLADSGGPGDGSADVLADAAGSDGTAREGGSRDSSLDATGSRDGSPDSVTPGDSADDSIEAMPPCSAGAMQCVGKQPQTCDATGAWHDTGSPCPYLCNFGACTGSCTPGTVQCSGTTPQTCDASGAWQSGSACPYVCSGGACTGTCTPGSTQCASDGVTPQTCSLTGTWQSGAACPYTCTAGACAGACSTGAMQPCSTSCGTTGTATCTGSFSWGPCAPPAEVCDLVDDDCNGRCDDVAGCRIGVDRSYNPSTGEHFYTTSDSEAACCGYMVETLDYYYLYSATQAGLVPFYRCALASGMHLYTTSSTCEGAAATNEGSLGWIATAATCGAVPLYRLYDGSNGDHFYTTSSSEAAAAEAGGYVLEFTAGYVWTAPQG